MIQKLRPWIENDYPSSDGRPMAETDFHRVLMIEVIQLLQHHFASQSNVYVSGNLLIFYEEGNKRRHVSPDAFVVKGVSNHLRPNYLVWEEGKGPDVVIEITSKTTKAEDIKKKFNLYESVLGVSEYFLFDPLEDYLKPSMQGYRRVSGSFRPIRLIEDRFPSKVLGLHLERSGRHLRLWNPLTGEWILTETERTEEAEARAEQQGALAEQQRSRAEEERTRAEEQQSRAKEERARAEEQRIRADQQEAYAEEQRARAEEQRSRAERAERELEELRNRLRES